MPAISGFEKSNILSTLFIFLWRKLEPGKLLLWIFSSVLISNYYCICRQYKKNIYETFAIRLTDCSSVIESCDSHAVVGGLLLYHKPQSPSSTASLPLTQMTPSNCVHFWLCIHMHFRTPNTHLPSTTWRVWFLLMLLSRGTLSFTIIH